FFIALAAALATGYLLYSTSLGYEIRVVGLNPRAARVARIDVGATYLKVFLISGFLAGLAGGSMVLGVFGSLIHRFSPGYGWDGITAALIARNNPYAVIPAALLLAALRTGSIGMMIGAGVSNELVLAVQGLILVAAAAPEAYSMLGRVVRGARGGGA
ncbi:MAG: ABC transporter permease, partial [Thermoprotei archaeon]